ncbi:hypothetical protein P3X46_023778 [Hevea brasiliensis]|uniref:Low-temperature-induced 65 kDa protein n=1 Tax=Hevea brasiliensis TaxID=3981 RepID=A0ABQ9LFR6_HEVBR|nr:hypothetical protein P3X46_023778 [Hevea brasiliensis]
MDSQMERPHGHRYDQEPHNAGLHAAEGENEHHQEKSVLKKVKAKARKIKHTLKLHGHGHNYDQNLHREGHIPDDHDLDKEDDKNEEFDDPEVRNGGGGSSIYCCWETSNIKEVPHTPLNKPKSISPGIVEQTKGTDPIGTFAREQEAIRGQTEVNLERPTGLEEDPHARKDRPGDHNPSNYQTKANSSDTHNLQENPRLVSKIASGKSQDLPSYDTGEKASKQSSYVEKISSATSAVAGKAISATNVVASKLGYEEKDDAKEREMHQRQDKAKAASPMEYGKRIVTNVAERLSPAYEKVAETGSTVMSKMHGTRAGTGFEVERKANKQDRGVSVKDYVAEKLKPGEEDGALSELISEALHKKKPEAEKADKPMGKVTESDEVKRRLGSMEENSGEHVDPSSVHVPGSAMKRLQEPGN